IPAGGMATGATGKGAVTATSGVTATSVEIAGTGSGAATATTTAPIVATGSGATIAAATRRALVNALRPLRGRPRARSATVPKPRAPRGPKRAAAGPRSIAAVSFAAAARTEV